MQAKGAGVVIALRMCGPVTLTKDEARKWYKQETDIGRKSSSIFGCSCGKLLTSIDGSNATTLNSEFGLPLQLACLTPEKLPHD